MFFKITLILGTLLFSYYTFSVSTKSERIIEVKNSQEIIKILKDFKNATIFLDIDDTLITPVSRTFRIGPHRKLIDEIKQNKDKYPNYEAIISNWRLQRKVMLVDKDWPNIINQLKELFPVYGLTKVDSGKFGNIDSMEKWRFKELKHLGIEFTFNPKLQEFDSCLAYKNFPVFYRGIFITGNFSKSQTLKQYKKILSPQFIIMIDDKIEQLKDVQSFCREESIDFFGILFKGIERLPEKPDPRVVSFQKNYLLQHAQWLEDDEALTLMGLQE